MKGFDQYIKELKQSEKTDFSNRLKNIDKEYSYYYMAFIIAKRWNDKFPDSRQAEYSRSRVSIYLNKYQNVAKDFMLFLEEIKPMIENRFKKPMTTTSDSSSVDFKWYEYPCGLSIWVYYGGSNCSRKLIRTETEVVSKPVYEIVCD